METKWKVLGGCFIVTSLILGAGFASAFASLHASTGGNFEEGFWMAFGPAMLLGLIVSGCIMAYGSTYFE